jgi:hypothetical protein
MAEQFSHEIQNSNDEVLTSDQLADRIFQDAADFVFDEFQRVCTEFNIKPKAGTNELFAVDRQLMQRQLRWSDPTIR